MGNQQGPWHLCVGGALRLSIRHNDRRRPSHMDNHTMATIEILGSGRIDDRESAFPMAVQLANDDLLCSFGVGGGALVYQVVEVLAQCGPRHLEFAAQGFGGAGLRAHVGHEVV